jgi:hypothetical protein
MRKDMLLAGLTFIGASICWCSSYPEPLLHMPFWLPVAVIVLLTGLSTAISVKRWLPFVVASIAGTLVGTLTLVSLPLTPTEDPLGRAYAGFAIIFATSITGALSLISALVGHKLSLKAQDHRRSVWIALGCCIAFAPVTALLAKPLVAWRMARNEKYAAERLNALSHAAQRVRAETGNPELVCDGQALKRNYSGPPFSESNWRHIAGNHVMENGYLFRIWCDQNEQGGYTIDAQPNRPWDGVREFCTDESGMIGCGVESGAQRDECTPCPK